MQKLQYEQVRYANGFVSVSTTLSHGKRSRCADLLNNYDINNKDSQTHEPLSDTNVSLCIEVMKNTLNKKPLYYYDGTVLFALIPIPDSGLNSLKEMSQKIIDQYTKHYPKSSVSIGIGDVKSNVSDFKDSIDESMEIIRIMKLLHTSNTVKIYSEMLSYILIYQMKDASICKKLVTVQQVCAFTALTVRKSSGSRHKSICEANFAWICARNYESTE